MAEASITPPLHLPSESHRYELTLSDYWRVIVKRRFFVILAVVSTLAGAILYTNAQTPLYSSSSAIRVTQSVRAFGDQMAALYMPQASDPMAVYQSSITGEKVLERVVIRLGTLPPQAKAADIADMVNEIRGSISTKIVGTTDMIRITVTYHDPEQAAKIANLTAATFAEVDLLEKTKQARTLRQFVEGQLAFFESKLKTTEEQIQNFRQTGKALGIAIGLEQKVADLANQKSQLLQIYTENHPDVVKVQEQIEETQAQIQHLPSNELDLARLQRELEIHDRSYRMMKEKYESARLAEVEQVSDVSVAETAVPDSEPISPRKNLNKILGAVVGLILGVILAFGIESLDTSIGTIEDVERTIRLPVVGIVPYHNPRSEHLPWWRFDAWIRDYFSMARIEGPNPANLIMNQDSFSTLAESYRILRTFIEFLLEKTSKEGKIIMITSTGPQEGKSLTSSNVAISLAQAGKKVLLVDTDLRRPVVHRLFGVKREPGLSDVLMGACSFDEARRTMGDFLVGENTKFDQMIATKMLDRLEILTTGQHTPSPAELLASSAMRLLLDQARLKYDYIILDTPPVLPVTDARTLGTMADVTFFVYRAGKTARRALIRAKDELELAGIKVRGIILNHATPEVTLTDQYYYQYYGDRKAKRPKKEKVQTND